MFRKIYHYFFGKIESNFEFYKKRGIFPRLPTLNDPYVGRLSDAGAIYVKYNNIEFISNPFPKKNLEKEVKKE